MKKRKKWIDDQSSEDQQPKKARKENLNEDIEAITNSQLALWDDQIAVEG